MQANIDDLCELARREPYGSLGLDPDPELGFAGIRALRQLADFCEAYQVRRLREAGNTWAEIASLAGVCPQALHKKHARKLKPRPDSRPVDTPPTANS